MDIQLVERLAAGGVSLEQARELVEVGGPEWSMIGNVIDLVEAGNRLFTARSRMFRAARELNHV